MFKKKLEIDDVRDKIESNTNADENIKIGEYARQYFTEYFTNWHNYYNLKNFLNKYWCNERFGICYPLLKEVDISIPISKQNGYNNKYARYWTKPILKINQKNYILCSQWFKEFQEKLDNWINENPIDMSTNYYTVNQNMDVYILPKAKIKTCVKCGKKNEKEILLVTYTKNDIEIKNKLFTYRCNSCNTSYIADTIYKTYTKSKNLDDIDVNFKINNI